VIQDGGTRVLDAKVESSFRFAGALPVVCL